MIINVKDPNNLPEYMNYFSVISSSDLQVNEKDIYYREKYNEILNYFKLVLTGSEDQELYNYINLKGALLIKMHPGSDIMEFLKLVSSNYYLEVIEFNRAQIFQDPENFYAKFNETLEALIINQEGIRSRDKKEEEEPRKLVIVNQLAHMRDFYRGKNLLREFLIYWQDKIDNLNPINNDAILVWITDDNNKEHKNYSNDLYSVFDLSLSIPILNRIEREAILNNFSEENPKISFDINAVASHTKDWEVVSINQLLKVAILKHFLNSDLTDTTNEITDIIIDLIESEEFLPLHVGDSSGYSENIFGKTIYQELSDGNDMSDRHLPKIEELVKQIQGKGYSEFMLGQLYESAASSNYSELVLVIDKLSKKEPIEENDRILLAKFPFVLNDTPGKAQINLEKAKKRVDLIKLAFGKE